MEPNLLATVVSASAWRGTGMRTPEEYQNMAAQCSHLARAINDPDSKVMLLEAAQTWIKLADYAAKAEAREALDTHGFAFHRDAHQAKATVGVPYPASPTGQRP
jgi:hypothetical protein